MPRNPYITTPIFSEPLPVHSADWFHKKIFNSPSIETADFVFLLADLLLALEYKCRLMYCDDLHYIPIAPPFYYMHTSVCDKDAATKTVKRVINHFVTCSVIPDLDRGWWHNKLNAMLDDLHCAQT